MDSAPRSFHLSARTQALDFSGIRKAFERGAQLKDPINLSIGQPDFPVPEALKKAAALGIESDRNGYSLTQGDAAALSAVQEHLLGDLGPAFANDAGIMLTSGTSGGLVLAMMALLDPGDEIIIPDPWFVAYPAMARVCEATAVPCPLGPDFRMTADKVAPLITSRTRAVLLNAPANPTGVMPNQEEMDALARLCREKGVVLLSDEIYDAFVFPDGLDDQGRMPSPARHDPSVLVIRGLGKSYGCTGWRLGYAAGPATIIDQMRKLQQFVYVCPPTPLQMAIPAAFKVDLSPIVASYLRRRDMVMEAFDGVAEVPRPEGAFYAWVRVPEELQLSGTAFTELAMQANVIVIPGGVFSSQDTHIRLSYATSEAKLAQGLGRLRSIFRGISPEKVRE
jgi:aspartate/methionine/tyrosine aminotransferase